jgi:hypothetical protein
MANLLSTLVHGIEKAGANVYNNLHPQTPLGAMPNIPGVQQVAHVTNTVPTHNQYNAQGQPTQEILAPAQAPISAAEWAAAPYLSGHEAMAAQPISRASSPPMYAQPKFSLNQTANMLPQTSTLQGAYNPGYTPLQHNSANSMQFGAFNNPQQQYQSNYPQNAQQLY